MYRRGGDPWIEPASGGGPAALPASPTGAPLPFFAAHGFAHLEPEDEELLVLTNGARDLSPAADETLFGPDAIEVENAFDDDNVELPEPDPEFDEDLSDVLAEIEAGEPSPVA